MDLLDRMLTQQDNVQPTRAKVKTIAIPQDPHFYGLIFKEIPGSVRQDKVNKFDGLLTGFINSSLPEEFASKQKLQEIHKRTIDNASVYNSMRDVKCMSIMNYIKNTDGPFPEIQFQESELKRLQKKIVSDEVIDLMSNDDLLGTWQCFHCSAVDKNESGPYVSKQTSVDPMLGALNVWRLQLRRGPEEAERHYFQAHTKNQRRNHKLLIPCKLCISQEKTCFFFSCCLNCW